MRRKKKQRRRRRRHTRELNNGLAAVLFTAALLDESSTKNPGPPFACVGAFSDLVRLVMRGTPAVTATRTPSNSHKVTLKPHIVGFPLYQTDQRILMEQTGSADAVHNLLGVTDMREAGSDSEEAGEREKTKDYETRLKSLCTCHNEGSSRAPTTAEKHRLSPNELDSDAEQQIEVVKQKDGSVDSSLKLELEPSSTHLHLQTQ
ncbi:hypothetical protein BLNAU_10815 [Blattamonas nauphoetae]|uniref:Uncharacterized protein n=1 Tax=Blattamonas nauphoetae TaxID=2049346 RepID=A0ABQ9XSV3_9EUKA|nr:hypothetical protein BLNAU_10815 [Blattamonas nauphoetae]